MDDLENELPQWPQHDGSSSDNESTTSRRSSRIPLPDIPMPKKTKLESGFHESTRLCLERVREAMLDHKWEEAAEYMAYYPQILEDTTHGQQVLQKELFWRIGIELLHHHPNSKLEDYNNIYERMKHAGIKQYLQVCLEHSFHLMLKGHIEEAKRTLSVAESWRYGKESAAQYDLTKLIQAYRSLLDYVIWIDKKAVSANTDYANVAENQSMHNYFKQATVNLKEIFKSPGVWDPFILCYVEMMEFYEDYEEAQRVLSDYAYDNTFPPNPNAHVYLYQYLQRHNAPPKKLTKVLKILHSLVPSHTLMMDYCSLLLESDKNSHVKKALGVTVDLLDYPCWRNNLEVWTRLKDIIEKLQSSGEDWKGVVSEIMSGRKDWWPALHFTKFHAAQDARENPELMRIKAPLAKILCPDLTMKYSECEGI